MKKILFAAMAALAITSCTQNEEIEAPAKKAEIRFNGIVNKSARATNVDKAALEGSQTGFYVYAYNVGDGTTINMATPFITNEAIKYTNNTWGSNNKYYWPTNADKIIFYAYFSPVSIISSLTTSDGATSPEITDYIVPNQATQEDLLVAKTNALDNTTTSVDFAFNHALTQVNFSIKPKVTDSNLTYTVSEITITGVHNQGTYKYDNGQWTNPNTLPTNITYTYPISASSKGEVAGSATTAVDLDDTSNLLILMPQTLTADAKINIKYKVTDKNAKTIFDATSTGKDIVIGDGSSTKWEAGHKIRYTLSLTNDAKDINYSVSNVNWSTPESNVEKDTPAS